MDYVKLRFTHFIDRDHCTVATAREGRSQRTRSFLITEHGDIYTRRGIEDVWSKLRNEDEYLTVRTLICEALNDEKVIRFSGEYQGSLN